MQNLFLLKNVNLWLWQAWRKVDDKKKPLNLEELCDISAKDAIEYYCQNAILSMDLNLLRVSLQEKLKIIV